MAGEAAEVEDEKTLFMAIVHAFFQGLTRPESLKSPALGLACQELLFFFN